MEAQGSKLRRSTLEHHQQHRLRELLADALPDNKFYQRKLGGLKLDLDHVNLVDLPFTTRMEVEEDQLAHPPYGTNLSFPLVTYTRVHQTSGSTGTPLRWLDTAESWNWFTKCWRMVYHMTGVQSSDRALFTFSFGPFIGFWAAFEAARDLGMFCLPAGGLSTLARLKYLIDHRANVVCCTPTYALRMAEVAGEIGIALAEQGVRKLIVAGEPGGSIPATRSRIEKAWNARAFDHAGMTEVGAWGAECVENPGGMHVFETEFIAEVIDPNTLRPVVDGDTGELVLTNLGRTGSPLIRYRTGDIVRLSHEPCPCGSSFARVVGGVLGRADSMIIIRGNNIFPSAIENLVREFPEIAEFRIIVDDRHSLEELEIQVETAVDVQAPDIVQRIGTAFRDRFHFAVRATIVPSGSLPRSEMKSQRVVRRSEMESI